MAKIILAQIDSSICQIEKNYKKIKEQIEIAKKENADLIIFPAYSLTGFSSGDIIKRHKHLEKEISEYVKKLAAITQNIIVILGYKSSDNENDFVILDNCKIKKENTVCINKETYKIICGEYDVAENKQLNNIIHISASDSRCGKEFLKDKYLSEISKENKINYIYVNSVGYNDNRCFDGASRIYKKSGKLTARAKSFEEDLLITTNLTGKIEALPSGSDKENNIDFNMHYTNDLDRLYKEVLCGIKGYFSKNGFSKAVLGLSDGLDSTICAVLLTDALGKENVVGISMPTTISSQGSKDDAKKLAENLGITYIEAPIKNEVSVFNDELAEIYKNIKLDKYKISTTKENIQARIRATLLWSVSNEFEEMLPIATSDKSEGYIGYATTNGDMSGGFAPISDVTKTKLFALGKFLNENRAQKNAIPGNILEKPPGAELKFDKEKGRTITAEEDNMPYPFLDEIIWDIENFGLGYEELLKKEFFYEKEHKISLEQKKEWLTRFYRKYKNAVFKWHLMPPGIITDTYTINQAEYYHPIV